MPSTSRPRYTIGQLMAVIAVTAIVLALPRLIRSPDVLVIQCLAGVLTTLAVIHASIEVIFGKVCPSCSNRALRRLARHPGYYRCMACRARLKRFGFGPWLDASGPGDAARYGRRSEAGVWKTFDAPRDLKGSISGALLGSKRSRDLIDELKQHPHRPDSGRRLEAAEEKVRAFLRRRREMEE
jgi:hypothetical protein